MGLDLFGNGSSEAHTHTRPFNGPLVRDYLGRPVPVETLTHSYPSWSSDILYQLPPYDKGDRNLNQWAAENLTRQQWWLSDLADVVESPVVAHGADHVQSTQCFRGARAHLLLHTCQSQTHITSSTLHSTSSGTRSFSPYNLEISPSISPYLYQSWYLLSSLQDPLLPAGLPIHLTPLLRLGFCWPLCTFINYMYLLTYLCLPCFDAVCWAAGRASGL